MSTIEQPANWLEEAIQLPWRAPVPSLNLLLTSTCWRNDHNGFSHQGPGLIDTVLNMKGTVGRIYLPPDANCLLSVADHCLRSRDYVNLIVIDKQPQLQWLDIDTAMRHCAAGASIWPWASNDQGGARADRFHVRGFIEEGTTTTPFDMVVRNQMSRFHLCLEALRRSAHPQAGPVVEWCQAMLARHHAYTREHFEDLPEIRDWKWNTP